MDSWWTEVFRTSRLAHTFCGQPVGIGCVCKRHSYLYFQEILSSPYGVPSCNKICRIEIENKLLSWQVIEENTQYLLASEYTRAEIDNVMWECRGMDREQIITRPRKTRKKVVQRNLLFAQNRTPDSSMSTMGSNYWKKFYTKILKTKNAFLKVQ